MNLVVLGGYAIPPGDLSREAPGPAAVDDRAPPELVVERARNVEIILTNQGDSGVGARHGPLKPETQGWVNDSRLAWMKRAAFLFDIAPATVENMQTSRQTEPKNIAL
jgi:hypothetical protein